MSENWNDHENDAAGTSDAGEISEGFGGDKKPPVSRSTLLLFGVFAVGLGMIWLLGLQAKPRPASAAQEAADSQVESAIADMVGKSAKRTQLSHLFQDTDHLVQMFYDYPGASSVPADELPANPFVHNDGKATAAPSSPLAPAPVGDAAKQARLRRAADFFATLKLQSIIVSKGGSTAMISGKLLSAGAKLGDFTVTEIDPQRVVLSLGQNQFELKLKTQD